MADHSDPIVSISSSYELDLYASASQSSCVLRIISTCRYFLTINPELTTKVTYRIFKVLLSAKGYVIIQARCTYQTFEKDMLIVYSINGEKIAQRELDEFVNGILLDSLQYHIVKIFLND